MAVSGKCSHCHVYIAELEILADGMHLLLIDPYNKPQLKVRYPGSAEYKEVSSIMSFSSNIAGHCWTTKAYKD